MLESLHLKYESFVLQIKIVETLQHISAETGIACCYAAFTWLDWQKAVHISDT